MARRLSQSAVLLGAVVSAIPLKHDCYGFPARDFSLDNFAHVSSPGNTGDGDLQVQTSSIAPDFELRSIAGAKHSLGDLLAAKPVFIMSGSYT